jgi:sugar lactone lactonase YvrE
MVFEPDGRFVRSFGKQLANGLHGMTLVQEGGDEFLLLAHTGLHEVWKTTLEGELVWKLEWPEVSRKYGKKEEFLPTSAVQAADGRIYVADGYGKSWVHLYDAERNWLRCIGGPGSAPGKLRTPHGLCIDTRGATPRLLVADRENNRLQAFDLEGEHLGVIG